ncbi:MAG: hypothetical protein KGL45_15675 [Gammaproteobacteria bacterium]|nr:hypothetical protein [Gammaproteobacteria bacterium]
MRHEAPLRSRGSARHGDRLTDTHCRNAPVCPGLAAAFLAGCRPARGAESAVSAGAADLARMSLRQLSSLQVTSVAKAPEALGEAPAAV